MSGRITVWPPVPPWAYLRQPAELPFPFGDERTRIFRKARLGLRAALLSVSLEPGAAVLVPAYHHSSEIEVLASAGLEVRFYDGGPGLAPDPGELEELLDPGARGLYLTHYLGFAQDGRFWQRWCRERDLLLIEDAAMAWPGSALGEPIGSHGDIAIFSPWKAVGLRDPGAVRLRQGHRLPEAPSPSGLRPRTMLEAHRAWVAQRIGAVAPPPDPGTPTPTADRATGDPAKPPSRVGGFLLPRLWREEAAATRRRNYELLLESLGDLVEPPFDRPGPEIFPFALPVAVDRKRELIAGLQAIGVEAFDMWAHPHPRLDADRFPQARRRRATTVALPVHQGLGEPQMAAIAKRVRSLVNGLAKPRPAAPRTLAPGDRAIDFALPDQTGREFRLSSLRGKTVVVYFFPEAGAPGCTAEACDLRDSSDLFGDFDAVPVGVSPDPPERLRRFDREHRLGHVLLSDVGERVAWRWGVSRRPGLRRRLGIGDGARGRVTFVIDRDGIVRATVGEVDVAGHARQVLEVLEEIEAPAATVG